MVATLTPRARSAEVVKGPRDRDRQGIVSGTRVREGGIKRLCAQMDQLAGESELLITHQRTGQQAGLEQNLEAVADSDHQPA